MFASHLSLVFPSSSAWCTVPSHPPMITHVNNSIVFFKINLVFNWRIIPYRILLVSAKHQHASAIGIHMSPPSKPPSYLPPHSTPLDCYRVPVWVPWVTQQKDFMLIDIQTLSYMKFSLEMRIYFLIIFFPNRSVCLFLCQYNIDLSTVT